MGVIKDTIDALKLSDLETDEEKDKKDKKPKKVDLTPDLVLDVVALAKEGRSIREIKDLAIDFGPEGQRWKLSTAQIREIVEYRQARYNELTAPEIDAP